MTFVAALLLTASISTLPPVPLIEQAKSGQVLNFDFLIENPTDAKVEITQIEASVLGANDTLIVQRRLGGNGNSIATLPERTIEPHAKIVVFNPFAEFESDIPLDTIRYDFTFGENDHAIVNVKPRVYEQRATLMLPVGGRVFVHDGHDFYGHHRRLDVTGDMTTAFHITSNVTRYAYDFVNVDEKGEMHRGDGLKNEDWYGFGKPIVAPADGVVVRAAGDRVDGAYQAPAPLTMDDVLKDLTVIVGNYVMIKHAEGEYSTLAHLRQGSVRVKAGDRVRQGQQIGEMGCSGDAMFPHLHYQLQSDDWFGEGLPSLFSGYRRFTGTKWVPVKRGQVDTGDVVERTP